MNSSLQRTCTARGRFVHISKALVPNVLKLPSGAEVHLGMKVDDSRLPDGRNNGDTFNVGISAAKRALAGTPGFHAKMREYKDAVWSAFGGEYL